MSRNPIPCTHTDTPQILRKAVCRSSKKENSPCSSSNEEFHHQCSLVNGEGSVKPPAEKKVPWLGLSTWLCFPDRVDTDDFWVMSWPLHLVTSPNTNFRADISNHLGKQLFSKNTRFQLKAHFKT